MSLQAKLDAFKAQIESGGPPFNIPAEILATMKRATVELIASGAADRALKAGGRMPAFSLEDQQGNAVSSTDLLGQGPLIISFYRGVWCPYCNMELQALQESLADFRARGANMVAISPQTAPNSRKAARENKLDFPILSDPGNAVAEAFGVRFRLADDLIEVYKQLPSSLPGANGDDSWTLPMPARYVVAPDGMILYAEVNADYTRRPEPEDMIPAIEKAAAMAG